MRGIKTTAFLSVCALFGVAQAHGQSTAASGMDGMSGMSMEVPQLPHAPVVVRVDSARHEVEITAGPFHLPAMPPGMDMMEMMGDMAGGHAAHLEQLITRFKWPMTDWLRGYHLEITDQNGKLLPQRTMHHMEFVNFDRRQLVYPLAERVLGIGEETATIMLPRTVGLPLTKGQEVGVFLMWNNDTGHDMDGVMLHFMLKSSPANLTPRPVAVLPFKVDVNSHPGMPDSWDVPPGPGTYSKASIFTVPVSGRLLGIGGHMHDHGVEMRIEDVATGKVLAHVHAIRDSSGDVSGVSRQLLAVKGKGPHLRVGREYRMVAVYENHSTETLKGVMAVIGGLFAPDNIKQWPAVDRNSAEYQRDIAVMLHPTVDLAASSTFAFSDDDSGIDYLSLVSPEARF
ncbi:MAG TPA: hypothetical protein VHW65_01380 [Gemmatimonadales bacterium]|jgi:hypothetical protein|nr:hypothetical protein [Gemmatimonadales bacterium]